MKTTSKRKTTSKKEDNLKKEDDLKNEDKLKQAGAELCQAQYSLSQLQTSLELTGLIDTYLASCDWSCSLLLQFLTTKILLEMVEI